MQPTPKNSELPYIDVVEILRRRFPIILLGALLGIAAASAYSLTATVLYESEAVVLVIQKDAGVATGTAKDLGLQSEVGEELLATHIQILTSPRVLREALLSKDENGVPLIARPSIARHIPTELADGDAASRKGAIAYIIENLNVSRGGGGASKNAQVLRVKLQHTDSSDCKALLEAIIKNYQAFLHESVANAGNEAGELIQRASDELEARVAEQHKQYRDFLHEAPMLWNYDGQTLNPHQLQVSKLEAVLSDIRIEKSEVESRLAITSSVIEAPNEDPLQRLTIFDGADVQRLALLIELDSESFKRTESERAKVASVEFGQLLALNLQAETDSLQMGKNHPKFEATRRHIDGLKQFLEDRNVSPDPEPLTELPAVDLDRLVVVYQRLLKHDLSHAIQREEELLTQIEQAKAASKEMIAYELEENRLRRELERSQSLYEAVVDRLREVTLARDFGGFITELISTPELGVKCWPKIPFVVALGGLLGILSGSSGALVVELADKSFKSQQDVEREMGCAVLSHVPRIDLRELKSIDDRIDPVVVTLHQPKSRLAESIRNLRTSIFFETKSVDTPILQNTSPNAGDGKTTISTNLAVSIAQTSQRVLLVECDLRRPTLAKVLGLDDGLGMSAILRNECSMDEAVRAFPAVSNLSIIPAGTIPDNPAELLALPVFRNFLNEARQKYDFVIIDSPPTGPVSDPVSIASAVDFVLVTLMLSSSARAAAIDCREKLQQNGGNIVGLVINNGDGLEMSKHEFRASAASENEAYYTF